MLSGSNLPQSWAKDRKVRKSAQKANEHQMAIRSTS